MEVSTMANGLTQKGKWYYATTRYKDANGNWKTKYLPTKVPADGRHKKEAKEKAAKLIAEFHASIKGDHSQLTLEEYSVIWFAHMTPIIRPNTLESYKRDMHKHVLPILGHKRIYTLHQKDIEDFIHQEIRICDERNLQRQKVIEESERNGTKPSFPAQSAPFYKSIKKHVNVLSQMLKYAVTVDDIPYNVADKIDKSIFRKLGGERFRGNSYTSEEVKKLQEAVMGTEIEIPVTLALTLALRRSEVIGLRWSAIDFENDVVHINHTCIIQDNKPKYVDLTKNTSSHADMYLSKSVKEYLKSVKQRQENDKKFYGKGYTDSDYVCRHSDGSLIKPNYVSQNFPKFLEANNLKRIRFHDLRHISGSIVLNSTGDLKLTSEYLRHSSIQVTGDIYSHVDLGRKKAAADILAATIVAGSDTPTN